MTQESFLKAQTHFDGMYWKILKPRGQLNSRIYFYNPRFQSSTFLVKNTFKQSVKALCNFHQKNHHNFRFPILRKLFIIITKFAYSHWIPKDELVQLKTRIKAIQHFIIFNLGIHLSSYQITLIITKIIIIRNLTTYPSLWRFISQLKIGILQKPRRAREILPERQVTRPSAVRRFRKGFSASAKRGAKSGRTAAQKGSS